MENNDRTDRIEIKITFILSKQLNQKQYAFTFLVFIFYFLTGSQ